MEKMFKYLSIYPKKIFPLVLKKKIFNDPIYPWARLEPKLKTR